MSAVIRSRLYLITGFAISALVVAGFSPTYYLKPLFDRPPLTTIMHLHAASFTVWLLLFMTQACLVASHRVALHRKLGIAGGFVAIAMVLLTIANIGEVMHSDQRIAGMPGWQFVALSSISITLFAAFVGAALALRRRPDWHKRFMLVATLGIMGPGVGRLLILMMGPPGGKYANAVLAIALVWCLLYDWFKHRIVHPAFVIGTVVLLGAIPIKQVLAHSGVWAQFVRWVVAS
jgi:hypothetical protein